MRRGLALALAAAALAGCGGDDPAPTERPRGASALAGDIRAAYAGAQEHVDAVAGTYGPGARPFLDRAAALWPRYLAATRGRPDPALASYMSVLYADGLKRPGDAARAQRYATEARPSPGAYVRLAYLHSRAGERRRSRVAGRKAIELAGPSERDRVRETIRHLAERPG